MGILKAVGEGAEVHLVVDGTSRLKAWLLMLGSYPAVERLSFCNNAISFLVGWPVETVGIAPSSKERSFSMCSAVHAGYLRDKCILIAGLPKGSIFWFWFC